MHIIQKMIEKCGKISYNECIEQRDTVRHKMTCEWRKIVERETYQKIIEILKTELIPALGCTEPIAIAYAAAMAKKVLGNRPEEMEISCSRNIIKNAKSVVVPMTGNLKGIEAAGIVGMLGGTAERKLEVLTTVTQEHLEEAKRLLAEDFCKVSFLDTPEKLHILVRMKAGQDEVLVNLVRTHMGISWIKKNGEVIYEEQIDSMQDHTLDYQVLNISSILKFAEEVDLNEIGPVLQRQIDYNTEIAKEGLRRNFGANVGKTLLEVFGDDVKIRAKAMPAAGSDARMNGCELPVIINSGSGNQGMTASLPVLEYARQLGAEEDKVFRALCISNLIAIYQKSSIGRLSAYCGAVSAAAGAGAGITYLLGGKEEEISQTIVNTLANISGIVCDGAKSSCAAKIASSVDAAIMATMLTMKQRGFEPGDGIVKKKIQDTMDGVVKLARDGMKETDEVILGIMLS